MKELRFRVDGQTLKAEEEYTGIMRDSHRYLRFVFSFCREWANYKKVVQVKDANGKEYNAYNTPDGVVLPQEITGTSRLYITVYGSNGKTTVKTNTVTIEQL